MPGKCGFRNAPSFKFCGECGRNLKKPTQPPPFDPDRPESYTPKFLADKILNSRATIEGEHKVVTVLFADVANYTSIAERLDPEEIHQIMDGCFRIMMDEIHKYEGTINQFTGDGVMKRWSSVLYYLYVIKNVYLKRNKFQRLKYSEGCLAGQHCSSKGTQG